LTKKYIASFALIEFWCWRDKKGAQAGEGGKADRFIFYRFDTLSAWLKTINLSSFLIKEMLDYARSSGQLSPKSRRSK